LNLSVLLFVAAIVLLTLFGLNGFGAISLSDPDGYLGFGLVAFAAAHLPLP